MIFLMEMLESGVGIRLIIGVAFFVEVHGVAPYMAFVLAGSQLMRQVTK